MNSGTEHRLHFLDGMRGWAAMLVFLSHLFKGYFGAVNPVYLDIYNMLPLDGVDAVFIFFVISGFALSTPYLHSKNPATIAVLALRRYPRLTIPILCANVLVYVLMLAGLMYNLQAAPMLRSGLAGSMYDFTPSFGGMLSSSLYNVYFNFSAAPYNKVLWTMPIEMAGSALIFVLLLVAHYVSKRFVLYAVALVGLFVLKSNLAAFVMGAMLAELYLLERVQQFRRTKNALP